MSQNGQTHFKNLAAISLSDHFETLCIKGLNQPLLEILSYFSQSALNIEIPTYTSKNIPCADTFFHNYHFVF